MNAIIQNYNALVKRFNEIENGLDEQDIHDKRVILRRIFPILSAFKIKPSKIKNGEKAFRLFGKLRDVQVQIMKLEEVEKTPEIDEYQLFIIQKEIKLKEKVRKFSKKKKLKFPKVKKEIRINYFKMYDKASVLLNNLIEMAQPENIVDTDDIHRIRVEFKKFRYLVEILSYMESTSTEKADQLKPYQDLLGEIHDYEVLMTGLTKYYSRKNPVIIPNLEVFEELQNKLMEQFENHLELFIKVCYDAISYGEYPRITNQKSDFPSEGLQKPEVDESQVGFPPTTADGINIEPEWIETTVIEKTLPVIMADRTTKTATKKPVMKTDKLEKDVDTIENNEADLQVEKK